MTDEDFEIEIDNENPQHRRLLLEALWSSDFNAYEFDSGGGTMHICVNLFEGGSSDHDSLLQVATGNIVSSCDVGLMGYRRGSQIDSGMFVSTPTLRTIIEAFAAYRGEREHWVSLYQSGAFDL